MKALEVISLSKSYGSRMALRGVSFEVEPGDAVALVGPNGAGKTTLLRILATLLKPTGGFARVMDLDGRFQASRIRRLLGYMPDAVGMEEDLTVREYLEFFSGLYGRTGPERTRSVDGLIELLDLGGVRDQSCGALSRGMQQRVGLARTLVNDPQLLLLDEPAANLDPRSRIEIREVLKELRSMGKTILISSHILMELAELCNKIAIVDQGSLQFFGAIAEVAGRLTPRRRIAVRLASDPERFRQAISSESAVEEAELKDGWIRVTLRPGETDYSFIVKRAVTGGWSVTGLQEEEAGLEEIFMRLTAKKDAP